jgi:hypothetical protein
MPDYLQNLPSCRGDELLQYAISYAQQYPASVIHHSPHHREYGKPQPFGMGMSIFLRQGHLFEQL